MSQITLYLDDETQALIDRAAQANGISKSRWVAELIRKHARSEWPKTFIDAAGSFPEFPLREGDGTNHLPPDLPREMPNVATSTRQC
ncbi:MAG: ribbon-helix-helix protein, CopG family [Burkholderiales bacterium]|nr:MAG: ribbon-helix-helix protein, CopG family [Burkholderiales bacterium]